MAKEYTSKSSSDLIRKITDNEGLIDILVDVEDYLDSNYLYAYKNWISGTVVEGPIIKRYWITIVLQYEYDQMPDPSGATRLLPHGTKVRYRTAFERRSVEVKSPSDYQPGTHKPRMKKYRVWLVEIRIPRRLIKNLTNEVAELYYEDDEDIHSATSSSTTEDQMPNLLEQTAAPLTESLVRGDLEHMVLPMLSIDEYSSKIDNRENIVVGFYAFDRAPADDLCLFIEKSDVTTLDTEVSPAPDPDGYYLVFVEMSRDKGFPKELMDLVQQVNNLTAVDSWQFKPYGSDDNVYDLSMENLRSHVECNPKRVAKLHKKIKHRNVEKKQVLEQPGPLVFLETFLQDALTDYVGIEDNQLVLRQPNSRIAYTVQGIYQDWPYDTAPALQVNEHAQAQTKMLNDVLGPAYAVFVMEDQLAIQHDGKILILYPGEFVI